MKIHSIMLASASASALAMSWGAAPAFAADAAASADAGSSVGEVVVTARRQHENLQNVPVSVAVVSGQSLQKQEITQANELSKLAPGLNLAGTLESTAITLRGVSWASGSGTPATPTYLNEVPFDPQNVLTSLYDLGQVEVLRGPQGTTRGAPSISGALTFTTHRPDLNEFGGYLQGSYGEGDHYDAQGAVNVPIIKDVLAIRGAFNVEQSDGNRVYSVNSSVKPSAEDKSYRLTALFKPIDSLTVEAMYQHFNDKSVSYGQVVGAGSPGAAAVTSQFALSTPAIAANFNGPALTAGQRKSVADLPTILPNDQNLITLNANWKVLGQQLSYNFGRQIATSGTQFLASDSLNMLPGFEPANLESNVGTPYFQTQEVRLASLPGTYKFFDYDLGYFEKRSGGTILFNAPTYLSGAFGRPNSALPGAATTPNSAYVLNSSTNIFLGQTFKSYYGNVQLHLWGTELSGGLAQVTDHVPVKLAVTTFPALNAVDVPFLSTPAKCALAGTAATPAGASTIYTGSPQICDVSIPAGVGNSNLTYDNDYKHLLYNASLSHKFGNVLAYFTTGTSFRSGLPAINNTGLPGDLTNPKPETATSYEVGVKTQWGPRLRINADVFEIQYQNQLTTFQGVNYFNSSTSKASTTSVAFYGNVNSLIRGFELEVDAEPIDHLSLAANISYSPITSQGGNVPCNVGPKVSATNPIDFCASPKGQNLNQTAPFQATFNGSYTMPLGPVDGYVALNANFQGDNPNFGNDPIAGIFKSTPAYTIVDFFAGVTRTQGKQVWDIGLYAKNIFDTQQELSRFAPLNTIYAPFSGAPGGYNAITTSLPREVGVKVNYSF